MSKGAQPSLISDLTAFTARLDVLRVDQDPDDLSDALRAAFKQRQLYNLYLFSLLGDTVRAKGLLEVFDKALQATTYDVTIFKRFRQLCGRMGLLPTSHIIPGKLIQTAGSPVARGGFGDVWEGIYNDKRVAIKALRIYKDEDVQKVKKVFCKEVVMWRRVCHPNVVPFLGVSEVSAPLCMVSEWMSNGNVRDYVRKNPESSRSQLMLDISRGLSFLHSLEIVHGDLKGDNILVDGSGCARLNDFGFTSIASLNCTETSGSGSGGTFRWMAPELFNVGQNEGKSAIPTRQSDIFALGMVTFEVFTGQVPFPDSTHVIVMKKIVMGERPLRPPKTTRLGLSDELWAVIQSSLVSEVEERPTVSVFVDLLETANPDIALLEELTEFDATSEEHVRNLRYMLGYGDNTLLGMRAKEVLVVIEIFDRVLNSSLTDPTLRSQCLHGLQKVSARCGLLPKSYWMSHTTLDEPDGTSPATGRAFSTRQRSINGELVAVKTISPDYVKDFNAFEHRLCTNAVMWKRLRHPNVVSFLGFGSDSPPFSLVYPWMSNGNLSNYVREHPDVDKLSLLLDVAQGLAYLHQYNLVHGNLTGRNVLVDSDGIACISECGLELVLRDEASSGSIPTNVRWAAPEVLLAEEKNKRVASVDDGKRADVYSFAMVMFEVLSGTSPFSKVRDEEVVRMITAGLRPEWPHGDTSQGLGDALSEQIEACWSHDPKERPTALMILGVLQELSEERLQESREPPDPSDDDTWDYVEATPELASSNSKEHKGHFILPSTLVNSSFGRLITSGYYSEGGTPKRDPSKSRRKRVKKRVRYLLHLSEHEPTVAEPVEMPKPETVLVDQREEVIRISDGSVSYLTSGPIPSGKKLKKVVVTIVSKDQGWSSYPSDHGTYRGSWTWFELSVGPPSADSGEKWRGEVVRNLHAHGEFKEHTIKISDKGLYEKAESGDVLTVWALAKFPRWKNTVKKVEIQYVVE